MPLRCPVCRALVEHGPQCRRCRADLSLLFTLEEQRRVRLERAALAAQRGDWGEVGRLAGEAHAMRRDEDSRRLLAAAALMRGDFAAAWRYYQGSAGTSSAPSTS